MSLANPDLHSMLADLEELVSCESPSDDVAALARSADAVARVGERRLGVEPELVERGGVTHVRWRIGAPGAPRILVLGHHDTVWPLGTLGSLPWSCRDDVVRGPGCFDMKAGIVQAFHALGAGPVDAEVTVLITGDEEVGAKTSRDLILEEAQGARAVLVAEPSADGGAIKVARKGYGVYRVEVIGRAAHAGLEPERGINATVGLAHAILAVADLADPFAGTTVTPTVASAGTTVNTVPDRALLRVDVRVETTAELERVGNALLALNAGVDGARLDVSADTTRSPMERASSQVLFGLARDVAAELGHPKLTGVAVGGVSDGNLTAEAGIRTLDGLGPVGGGAHSTDEHVLASAMPARARLLRGLVEKIAAGQGH